MSLPVRSRPTGPPVSPPSFKPLPLTPPALTPRRLVTVAAGLFAVVGAVFGTWAARVPDVSEQVGASHAQLGGALLCVSLGALAAMQLTGAICARLGPGLVGAASLALLSVSLVLPALTASPEQLCGALLLFGAGTGAANVAANSLGVLVEARHGRPLMPALHAAFSFGGLLGALSGGLASAYLGPAPHLLVVAGLGLLAAAALAPTLVQTDATAPAGPATTAGPTRRRPLVLVLGALAACTAFGEGALTDWGALHLRTELHAGPAVAAAGYAGFCLSMALGRLAGATLLQELGDRRLLSGGALLAAAGGLLVALSPTVGPALLGFVLVGLGLANVFPLAIGRAGAVGGAGGVALASTLGYTGLLGGPPLIGLLAEWAGTALALCSVPLMAVAAAVLATRLPVVHRGRAALSLPVLSFPALPLPRQRLAELAVRCRAVADGHAQDLTALVHSPSASRDRRCAPSAGMEFLAV
ncbi:MAG TPA: MFS transporter [Mycobacteriales bacterium]|jgi:hypothetical protein|nr:MFS transporter [Mycobacteriales bacterium]